LHPFNGIAVTVERSLKCGRKDNETNKTDSKQQIQKKKKDLPIPFIAFLTGYRRWPGSGPRHSENEPLSR
jgi:hypothetical protein